MRWKTWTKENKNLLIIGVIIVIIVLGILYIEYENSRMICAFPEGCDISDEEQIVIAFVNNCSDKCALIEISNLLSLKEFCCESTDINQNGIIEENGDIGPELCALAYECDLTNCADYEFDTVEGCNI